MRSLAVVLALAAAAVRVADGQQPAGGGGQCELEVHPVPSGTTRSNLSKQPSGKYNVFIGGGFVGNCTGRDVRLQSDSAEYYGDQGILYLIGNVHYTEPRAKVDSRTMTYWTAEEHIRAEGDVVAVLQSGTTMHGSVADYYRVAPNIRTQAELVATERPQLAIVQRDSVTGQPAPPINVVADRITSKADSLVYAGGSVRITRPELTATGDSAFLDNGLGTARLLLKPVVEGQKSRPFRLTGGVIDVFSHNRLVERIVATPDGHAVSNDLQLFADSIDMRVRDNLLQRAIAWGKGRAHATSPDRDIVADSIDAILPGQRAREIRAVRGAYVTSIPDTATIVTTERDWMRGDTIVARFDTVAQVDSGKTPPVRNVVAQGHATSYYHVKNKDNVRARPSINYVRGNDITVALQNNAVQSVTVVGNARGVYVEAADSTAARPPGKNGVLGSPKQLGRPGGRP